MGNSTISMAIFHCYVSSPEGIHPGLTSDHQLWERQVVFSSPPRRSEISFCGKSPSGSGSEPLVEGGETVPRNIQIPNEN